MITRKPRDVQVVEYTPSNPDEEGLGYWELEVAGNPIARLAKAKEPDLVAATRKLFAICAENRG